MTVHGPIRELRRLLYRGEWIESHALHLYLLDAPISWATKAPFTSAADNQRWLSVGWRRAKPETSC